MQDKQCMTHGFRYTEGCKDCEYCKPQAGSDRPAFKADAGKPDMSLITYSMLEPAAKILKFGAAKYGVRNYRNPNPGFENRLIAATLRHLLSHTDGEVTDPESGEPHLAHALTSLMLIFDRRAHAKEGEEL